MAKTRSASAKTRSPHQRERHRLAQQRCWRNTSPEKKVLRNEKKKQQRQSLAWKATCKTHPQLESFLVQKAFTRKSVEKQIVLFLTRHLKQFRKSMCFPMRPLGNQVRWNFQTPQPIRVFFAKDVGGDGDGDGTSERLFCGESGIMRSAGPDPRSLRVLKWSKSLSSITVHVTERVKKLLMVKEKWRDTKPEFNSVEVKICLGEDMFDGIFDGDGNQLRLDCNKKINAHSDCTFDKDGKQLDSDSTDANHPIVTVCVGAPRKLTFGRKRKNGFKEITSFELHNNQMFVLLSADDEAPRKVSGTEKVVHKAEFMGSGVSIAMVFRHVRRHKTGKFDSETGLWKFEGNKSAERFLEKNKAAFDGFHDMAMHRAHVNAVDKIGQRMVRALKQHLN